MEDLHVAVAAERVDEGEMTHRGAGAVRDRRECGAGGEAQVLELRRCEEARWEEVREGDGRRWRAMEGDERFSPAQAMAGSAGS